MASADSGESKPAGEEGAAANPEHINLKVEYLQGVFFNWAHPEFAKCRLVSNRFQKNDRVPDWPPLWSENA